MSVHNGNSMFPLNVTMPSRVHRSCLGQPVNLADFRTCRRRVRGFERLHNQFFGNPLRKLQSPLEHIVFEHERQTSNKFIDYGGKVRISCCEHKSPFLLNYSKFNVIGRFLGRKLNLQNRLQCHCCRDEDNIKGPVSQWKAPVSQWRQGIFFVRCSAFVATIAVLGMLVLYGQVRAQAYINERILPSVATVMGNYLGRKLNLGKVHRISPLGFALESCSLGPQPEEFSCGELPNVKVRIRPWASLQRRQVVVDAVLVQPHVLVAQKEDWTWLGIPTPLEKPVVKHSSNEEGIDPRTKARRLAREQTAIRWAEERNEAARKWAQKGYKFVGIEDTSFPGKGVALHAEDMVNCDCMNCMKEEVATENCFDGGKVGRQVHLHHKCTEGVCNKSAMERSELDRAFEQGTLNKHFSLRNPAPVVRTWLKENMVKPIRHRFKRSTQKSAPFSQKATMQRRNLDRSAAAARKYFDEMDKKQNSGADRGMGYIGNSGAFANPELLSSFVSVKEDSQKGMMEEQDKECSEYIVMNVDQHNCPPTIGRNEGLSACPVSFDKGDLSKLVKTDCKNHVIVDIEHPSYDYDIRRILDLQLLDKGSLEQETISEDQFKQHLSMKCTDNEKGSIYKALVEAIHNSCQTTESCKSSNHLGKQGEKLVYIKSKSNEASSQYCDTMGGPSQSIAEDQSGDHSEDINVSRVGKLPVFHGSIVMAFSDTFINSVQRMSGYLRRKFKQLANEFVAGAQEKIHIAGSEHLFPVVLDSVYFRNGTLMLLGYGDEEPRVMENINGHLKFHGGYERLYAQLSGRPKEWRTGMPLKDGGELFLNVFVDHPQQKWHVNIKGKNLFAPLFENLLEIPIVWSNGRASGEVHICLSKGENFPNLHGQIDVRGLEFQILDAPSSFSALNGSLCFRGQRIFLHNARCFFGEVPLEVSGDFGINPEDGEYHLLCQVPNVEVNALMRTLDAKPLLFPLAGSLKAVFNCQGPLDIPVFVGGGIMSKKNNHFISNMPSSAAAEAVMRNKEFGAVAAIGHVPFSYVSANFTFNTDSRITDVYGIRATLTDGGEIRGAGNAWICPEGEMDDSAVDFNFSGNVDFDNVVKHFLPNGVQAMPMKLGYLNGEAKVYGSILKTRYDIKWTAPKAEGSFTDARGDIIISDEAIIISSSSITFDLVTKIQISYPNGHYLKEESSDLIVAVAPDILGVDADLRLQGFDILSLTPFSAIGSPKPMHMKLTGRAKFHGSVVESLERSVDGNIAVQEEILSSDDFLRTKASGLVGDVQLSGIKLNQLLVAPNSSGLLAIFPQNFKLNATGRPDENLVIEFICGSNPASSETSPYDLILRKTYFCLQKGQLRTSISFQPGHSGSLEVRHLELDELELASLRGMVQKAELELNFHKRKGQGKVSVMRPRFSGVQGESLDVSARWSGDVITLEKSVLEQACSKYELQGEYVLPGTRDRSPGEREKGGMLKRAMAGQLGSLITSLGRWRLRLEVPGAEIAEMLPFARLLSRSSDPAVLSRSKELFIQGVQNVGFFAENLQNQLEATKGSSKYLPFEEGTPEAIPLPGLAELKGRWHGSLDASGGGNGDTTADFDLHGEEWEWGAYKSQRVIAVGSYSNNNGLRLDKILIQRDKATIHADGTLLGPRTNLHFAVLNFPVGLVPYLLKAFESSTMDPIPSSWTPLAPLKGILHMEGDLRGSLARPQCDVQVRLLDGAIGGVDLERAEVVACITSANRFVFDANFKPVIQSGHVHVIGSLPVAPLGADMLAEENMEMERNQAIWAREWIHDKGVLTGKNDTNVKKFGRDRGDEGWEVQLTESLKGLEWNLMETGAVKVDATVKDGGMMLITALSPYVRWLQGSADIVLQIRGTVDQPLFDGAATFHRASVYSPVLPTPLSNFGGTINVRSNQLSINGLEGRVGRKGRLLVKGNLPLRTSKISLSDKIEMKSESLEVRAKNIFSGQVDSQIQVAGSILEPEVSGMIKLSRGEAYLSQEKGTGPVIPRLASNPKSLSNGRVTAAGNIARFYSTQSAFLPVNVPVKTSDTQEKVEKPKEQAKSKPKIAVHMRDLKLHLGPELRIVYPLILNFAVSGELELSGLADPKLIKPKGTLTFENGDVNLVATQVRLKRDHPNRAKFEPEEGLDPTLDLALVGADWQLKIQGRASNWQDNLVVTSTRSGEQDVLSPIEAARVFESQLAESLLEGDGQLAFKKLAAATLETLMPRIEGKGEFGQARWRVVSAPQIPNLSLDPQVDPLKLLSNIAFGAEVEVQLGKHLQASVVRQLKESEMATHWTLLYQLSSRLRILFQSIPSGDKRLLFEYSATSQS